MNGHFHALRCFIFVHLIVFFLSNFEVITSKLGCISVIKKINLFVFRSICTNFNLTTLRLKLLTFGKTI